MTDSVVTVLAALAAKASPLIEPAVAGEVEKWTEWLVAAASSRILPKLPTELQGAAASALKLIEANADVLGGTTAAGFAAIVSHVALGDEDAARLVWLGSVADFDARMAALDDASAATRAAVVASADRWATVKSVALEFLKAFGTAGLPLLLSIVGI